MSHQITSVTRNERLIYYFLQKNIENGKLTGWAIIVHRNGRPSIIYRSQFAKNMVYKRSENGSDEVFVSSGNLALIINELTSDDTSNFSLNTVNCPSQVADLLNQSIADILKKSKCPTTSISTITNSLKGRCNATKIGDLLCLSDQDLKMVRNIGKKLRDCLANALSEAGNAKMAMLSSDQYAEGKPQVEIRFLIEN